MNMIAAILADIGVKNSSLLEQISWGANIVLACAAIFALWQVRAAIQQAKGVLEQNRISLEQLKLTASQLEVSRADIILRSRREAIAVALEQCKRFAESIVPLLDSINKEMAARNYQMPQHIDPDFPLLPREADPLGVQIWMNEAELRAKIVHCLNELESFAMYFASDLADENVAFTPTALTFCQNCEYYRLFIGAYRQPDKMRLYQNLVKLYGMWKPRLEKTTIEEQAKLLEAKKQKLPPDKKGTPLGTVL